MELKLHSEVGKMASWQYQFGTSSARAGTGWSIEAQREGGRLHM